MSQARIVTDALTAVHTRLPELVAAEQGPAKGALFTNTHREDEPTGPLVIRLDPADIATIDKLVKQSKAKNRSAMCRAALREYFAEN